MRVRPRKPFQRTSLVRADRRCGKMGGRPSTSVCAILTGSCSQPGVRDAEIGVISRGSRKAFVQYGTGHALGNPGASKPLVNWWKIAITAHYPSSERHRLGIARAAAQLDLRRLSAGRDLR